MRLSATLLALGLLLPAGAIAGAPDSSLQPPPRPGSGLSAGKGRLVIGSSGAAVRHAPRPLPRPEGLVARPAVAAVPARPRVPPVGEGQEICSDHAIRGRPVSPIRGRLRGCGVADPVAVTSVAGVTLSDAAVVDCRTAEALKRWVVRGAKPVIGRLGGGIAGLRVAAHYACRSRNNQPGAKISEHGKGHAIDISAIRLENGVTLTVAEGWDDPLQGKLLKAMHDKACGPFGTVLGPSSDSFHQDHFHFDTARYRAGPYCR